MTAELGEVILVPSANLLDETMNPQSFEQPSDLARVLVQKMLAQAFVGETTDEELTAHQEPKKRGILLREEIEALVPAAVFCPGFSQPMEFLDTDFGGLDFGDELEVALVSGK